MGAAKNTARYRAGSTNPTRRSEAGTLSNLQGDCSDQVGDCSGLVGHCTHLRGDCSDLLGNLDSAEQVHFGEVVQAAGGAIWRGLDGRGCR